jgi:hypothetical protein
MDEAERLSGLIAGVYDAALDPALWPVVLRKAGGFANGSAAAQTRRFFDRSRRPPHFSRLGF